LDTSATQAIDEGLVGMAVGGVRRVQVGLLRLEPSQYKMILIIKKNIIYQKTITTRKNWPGFLDIK